MTEIQHLFLHFGLAGLIGLLIGLERAMVASENTHAGPRDFIIFALFGAMSGFAAVQLDNTWLIALGFVAVILLVLSGYWSSRQNNPDSDPGITTELVAIVTFSLGLLVISNRVTIAVGLTIVLVAVLSQKRAINRFSASVQFFELEAALKLLIISFIVLPILPQKTLDGLLGYDLGEISSVTAPSAGARDSVAVSIALTPGRILDVGESVALTTEAGEPLGTLRVTEATRKVASGELQVDTENTLREGTLVRAQMDLGFVNPMLAAINPFKVWLIVVLVSFISFIGYVLIKVLGSAAGIGLTGVVGGLASSTVTTLSFAKRSLEVPAWNRDFAVAVILASSVMFPRLLVQISVVNIELMKNIAVPILIMGGTGIVTAAFFFLRSRKETSHAAHQDVSFDNPFSLASALKFAAVFACILMLTRLAVTYLGSAWLPVVSIVSGLTDADAIAFSLSDAQEAGIISLDWASFNLVLGALSNTFMKLFLVLTLGHRGLFKYLLVSFLVIGAVGIVSMFLYYDLSAMA